MELRYHGGSECHTQVIARHANQPFAGTETRHDIRDLENRQQNAR